ncbi:MAG: hypothetical protein RJA61_603 [Candidatus Parcubacteria bacterium]|jgi:ribose 5-phosphate isomerase B
MKVYIGSDHAGFDLKERLKPFIESLGYEIEDKGAFEYDPLDDYPDFIIPVAQEVARSPESSRGIVIGGSGQGEAIAANRIRGIRAVVFNGQTRAHGRKLPNEILLAREHNNANVLSLGARFLEDDEAKDAVRTWLETEFTQDERHIRRLKKVDDLTSNL